MLPLAAGAGIDQVDIEAIAQMRMTRGDHLDQRMPPLGRLHRAMRVLAIGHDLEGEIAGDVAEHEFARVAEDLVEDPRQIFLGDVLHHVGADHAVEFFRGQSAEGRIARVVAGNALDAPKILDRVEVTAVGEVDVHRAVLHPLAGAVIEDGARAVRGDQSLNSLGADRQGVAGEHLLRRNALRLVAAEMHFAIHPRELQIARAGIGAVEFPGGLVRSLGHRRHRITSSLMSPPSYAQVGKKLLTKFRPTRRHFPVRPKPRGPWRGISRDAWISACRRPGP